jgi:threonine aldolase
MGTLRDGVVRAVVHYMIGDEAIDAAAAAVRSIVSAGAHG